MSKGEVVFTAAAATGIVCVVAAVVCAWILVTDPAGLMSMASPGDTDALVSVVVRAAVRVASAVLSLIGW